MPSLQGGRVESLGDELVPERPRELPEDVAQIDAPSRDESLLAAIEAQRDREAEQGGRSARGHGRPTIAMPTSVRLLVLEDRSGGGDETLLRELSGSLRLRRFCLIPIDAQLPEEAAGGDGGRGGGAGTRP